MIYLLAAALGAVIFIFLDFKWNRDPFSPLFWALFFYLCTFITPGFFQNWISEGTEIIGFYLYPFKQFREHFLDTPGLALFTYVFGFGMSYLMTQFILRRHKIKAISFQVEKLTILRNLNWLGILGSLVLFHLLKFDIPYNHMKGYGWANWLTTIFGFIIGFLSIRLKETRTIAIVNLTLAISVYLFVLDRKSNSVELMIGLIIIIINFRKIWTWKRMAVTVILFTTLLVGKYASHWKWYDTILPAESNTVLNKTKLLLGGEVGRFNLIAGIYQVRTPSMAYDPLLFLRKIPFSGYIPYVKESNRKYGEISENWLYGKKIAKHGGIPMLEFHEIYFIFNSHLGILLLTMIMGILLAYIYESTLRLSNDKSNLAISLYALFWLGNNQAIVPEIFYSFLGVFFVLLFGKIKLVEV